MRTNLNKSTKARLKRVAQSADKAADFLTRAHGDTYNLPEYSELIRQALDLVLKVQKRALDESKASPPPPKPKDEGQTDIEDVIGMDPEPMSAAEAEEVRAVPRGR